MSFLREARAVFIKEIRTEWRTRVALSSVILFAVGSLTLIGLALEGGQAIKEAPLASALLWVVLLFTAATGLGRAYVQEEERGTALALRLTARATTVFAGKAAANVLFLLLLTLIATPVLLSLLNVRSANIGQLACVLILGNIGIAAVFTITGALVAQATAKGGLLAALSFPVLTPLLVAGVHGTNAALYVGKAATDPTIVYGDLQVLASYAVIAVTASLMLIEFVWNEE